MNFFANFGRINTIFIRKIAVESPKLCVKTSFWYIPEIIARIFNKQGGEGWCQRFRYITEGGGILLKLRAVTREGGPNFYQKQRYVKFEWSLYKFVVTHKAGTFFIPSQPGPKEASNFYYPIDNPKLC